MREVRELMDPRKVKVLSTLALVRLLSTVDQGSGEVSTRSLDFERECWKIRYLRQLTFCGEVSLIPMCLGRSSRCVRSGMDPRKVMVLSALALVRLLSTVDHGFQDVSTRLLDFD